MPGNYIVPVDPRELVFVTLREKGESRHVLALSCRYLPVDGPSGRGIAVEILYDPAQQQPSATYYCQVANVQRIVLAPKDLLSVRPYTTAPAGAVLG